LANVVLLINHSSVIVNIIKENKQVLTVISMPISSSAQRSSQTHPPRRGINNTKNKKRKAIAGGLIPTSFPSVPSPSAYYGSPPPGAALTFPTGPSSAYASSAFDHGFFRPAESAGGGSVSRPSFAVKLKPPSGPSGYSGGGPKTRAPTYHPAGSGDSFPFEKLKPPSGPSGYSGGGPKTRAPTYPFGIISSPLGQLKPPSGPSGFTGGGPKTRAPTVFRGHDDEEYYYNHQQHPLQHPPPSHGYHQHSDSFYNIPPSACFYQGVSASQLRNGFGGGCHADYFFQQQPVRDHYRGRFSSWPQHVSSPHHHFLHSPDEYYEEESDNEFTHNHGDGHESANDNDDDDCEDDGNDNDDNDEEEDVEEDSHQPQQPQHKNTKRPTTTTPCHAPDGSWYATSNSSSSSTSDVGDWDLAKEDEDETEDERVRQKINIHKAAIHKIKQKKRNSSRHSLFVSAPRNKKSRRTCNFIDDEALETNDRVDEESEDNLEDFGNDDKEDTEVGEESEFEFVDDKEDDHPPHFNDEEDDHADNQGKEFPALFESSSDDDDFPTVPSQYPALFESSDDETLENNVTDGASDTATLQTQTSNIVVAANPAMQPRTIFDCPIITSFPRPSFSKDRIQEFNYNQDNAPIERDAVITYETMGDDILLRQEPLESQGIKEVHSFVKEGRGMLWHNRTSAKLHYETSLSTYQEFIVPKATKAGIPHRLFRSDCTSVQSVVDGPYLIPYLLVSIVCWFSG